MGCGTPWWFSVNVSALEFRRVAGFVERISRCWPSTACTGALAGLELTESVLLQDAQECSRSPMPWRAWAWACPSTISELAIYSAWPIWKKLTIHRLKIDKSFVGGLPGDGERAYRQAIVSMGRGTAHRQ